MQIGILIVLVIALLAGVIYFFFGTGDENNSTVRNMVESQRNATSYKLGRDGKPQKTILDVIDEESRVKKVQASSLTLEKKLRYAQWDIAPSIFYGSMVLISLFALLLVSLKFNIVIKLISLAAGPIAMYSLLSNAMMSRFKRFDADYPSFLLSLVGLLKTGMNPVQALQAAAEGLEPRSLVKLEIDLMLERLRIGIPEDQSIGAFGEDIYHEEIELFVQALLLSRKVGGNLSDTLDRLAKQVRKRQYFRSSAHHAVGMQRGSIWLILAILVSLLGFIYYKAPDLILEALNHEIGWQVWQGGLVCIVAGLFWITRVTKIRA